MREFFAALRQSRPVDLVVLAALAIFLAGMVPLSLLGPAVSR